MRSTTRRTSGPGAARGRVAGAFLATGLAMALALLGPAAVAGAQDVDEPMMSDIAVEVTPAEEQPPCVDRSGALGYAALHGPTTFTLRISVPAPLCDPLTATAAIYAMPGGGVAWPQNLVEFSNFTIAEAGTVEVTFTKGCDPVQFDVLTGATPQTVSPWGEWHGPLLFPFDVDTTYQHWGADCDEPTTTTTTAPPVTAAPPEDGTTTTTSTTTTTEPEVLSVSEETPPPGDEPVVLAAGQVPEEPASLAFTGMGTRVLLLAAATLLVAGAVISGLGRRRAAD